MVKKILLLRLKQLGRIINSLGLFRAAFMLGLIGFGVFALINFSTTNDSILIKIGILSTLPISIQLNRKDFDFLQSLTTRHRLITMVEYFIVGFPLTLVMILTSSPLYLIYFTVICIVSSYIPQIRRQGFIYSQITQVIPPSLYEWKAGIRKAFMPMVLIYITAIATSFWEGSIPIAIIIMGIIISSFYEQNEDYELLVAQEKAPFHFLATKTKINFTHFSLICLPLLVIYLVIHPNYWYISPIIYLCLSATHVYIILCKYAFYIPNTPIGGGKIFYALAYISVFIPILYPLLIILSIYFTIKAKINLNTFLNDFD